MRFLRSRKKRTIRKPQVQFRSRSISNSVKSKRLKTKLEFLIRKNYLHIRNFVVITIVILVSYIGYTLFIESGYLSISSIEVNNATTYVSERDLRTLAENNLVGKNILLVNAGDTRELILKNFLGAKDVSVVKKYPGTLKIDVTERVPKAVVENTLEDKRLIVDEDGYVLGLAGDDFDDFPNISVEQEMRVGSFIDAELIPVSFLLIETAEKKDASVWDISFTNRYIKFKTGDFTDVYLSRNKDISNSMEVVLDLENRLTLEGKSVKKIDLRYDKVIVLYD